MRPVSQRLLATLAVVTALAAAPLAAAQDASVLRISRHAVGQEGGRLGAHPVAGLAGRQRRHAQHRAGTATRRSASATARRCSSSPTTAVRIDSFRFSRGQAAGRPLLLQPAAGRPARGDRHDRQAQPRASTTDSPPRRSAYAARPSASTTASSERGDACALRDRAVYVQRDRRRRRGRERAQGELGLSAGQFGLIAPDQRPLFLSADPGLQFTPPATFIRSVMAGSVVNTGRNLECADHALARRRIARCPLQPRDGHSRKIPGVPLPARLAGLLREAKWLLLVAIAAYLLLIFATFQRGDPGWSHSATGAVTRNAGGVVGAWLVRHPALPVRPLGLLVGGAVPRTWWSGATAGSTARR